VTLHSIDAPPLRLDFALIRPPGLAVPSPRHIVGKRDHSITVRAIGELDLATAPLLTGQLIAAATGHTLRASWATNPHIELDLSSLTFLDTGGITGLEQGRLALKALGCGVCLSSPQPAVLRILDFAVRNNWLHPDKECAGSHPWSPVPHPIRDRAARPQRHRPHLSGRPRGPGRLLHRKAAVPQITIH
jgi:anti-anti-sigma factor